MKQRLLQTAGLLTLLLLRPAPALADCQEATKWGQIHLQPQHSLAPSKLVLAAPHGGFDLGTDQMAEAMCVGMHWQCLIAKGFRTSGHPINVNRPTEGVGLASDQESHTPRAKAVYDCYLSHLLPLKPLLYVELHGNSRKESQQQLEIALINWPGQALLLKRSFQQALLAQGFAPEQLDAKVQGVDKLHFVGASTRRWGVYQHLPHALAIEIPRWVRKQPAARQRLELALAQALLSLPAQLEPELLYRGAAS